MALVDGHLPVRASTHGRHVYVRPPQPIHFPSEEEVPETKRHLLARTTLFLLLQTAFSRTAAIGSEQFVYWDAEDPRKCLAPDAFLKLGARDEPFDNWKVWERSAPDLAVEIVSPSDRRDEPWSDKLARYRMSGIREVVRFDPEVELGAPDRRSASSAPNPDNDVSPIRVWDRVDGDLVERSADDPGLRECATLDLWWTIVTSPDGSMLRLARDREGHDLLPTPDEDRMRLAEELAQERSARTVAEHERLLAEHERLLAEHERAAAQQKLQEETAAHERERRALLEQIEQLRAELSRARGQ